ncbi:MAG: hypothetical protein HOH77_14545 [Candidatus Latescibacteria bacterium]|jgi:hypothetical protein|nr:hypothetical protein [Candidatus Latescibacterota bacterium]
MTWAEVTLRIRRLLDDDGSGQPRIGRDVFDEFSRLLRVHMPEVIAHPPLVLACDKSVVVAKLSQGKGLDAASLGLLDAVYRVLSDTGDVAPLEAVVSEPKRKVNKLKSLADCLSEICEQFFNCSVSYSFETQPDWLRSVPDRGVYDAVWKDVSAVYAVLVDDRWTLTDRLEEFAAELKGGRQRVDIWFEAPLNCMVEFDETQHFNPFRLKTLQAWDGYAQCSFDYDHYLPLTEATTIPAGETPFQRLKNFDPLFPPMLDGEAQDNRIRQRAFRDFLKDITPLVMPKVNPTIRMSYMTTNGRIRDFTGEDFESVEAYIRQGGFLERMQLMPCSDI